MKNYKSFIWGLILVILGSVLALRSVGILDFNIFFPGWWTLFLIIPGIVEILTEDNKQGGIISLTIGAVLLLAYNDVFSFETVWKLLLPFILIFVGLSFMFKNFFMAKVSEKVNNTNAKSYNSSFSSQNVKIDNEKFEGCDISAVFGGVGFDLSSSIITEDVVINVKTVFGGVDIKVPQNVRVKVTSNSLFGGVDNHVKVEGGFDKQMPTIYVNASCTFGGVDIKC